MKRRLFLVVVVLAAVWGMGGSLLGVGTGLPQAGAYPALLSQAYLPFVVRPLNTPTPAPCNTTVQVLSNGSFESGWSGWAVYGNTSLTTARASQGSYSALLGGENTSGDGIRQRAAVPDWAETAAVYFDAYMTSSDSPTEAYDALGVGFFDVASDTLIEEGYVPNTTERNVWITWRMKIDNIVAYRGHTVDLLLAAFTDSEYPTSWYTDNVRLVFGCGSQPAIIAGDPAGDPVQNLPAAPEWFVEKMGKSLPAKQ